MSTTSGSTIPRKLKVNDRVKRSSIPGCLGTVKAVKTEVTAQTVEAQERGIMINVLWDNGTDSFVGPDVLEIVK